MNIKKLTHLLHRTEEVFFSTALLKENRIFRYTYTSTEDHSAM